MVSKIRAKGLAKGLGKLAVSALCLITLMFAVSLTTAEARKGEAPRVLRIAVVPAEDIAKMVRAFEPTRQYLERELGLRIEVFKATDYTAVIEAMRAKKIEVAYFGPFSYVLAAKRANARAIVGGSAGDGRLGVYHSILITHKDSGLRGIDDVKARKGKLTLSFVDPASTSGHLIPRGAMESIGIRVDRHFREIIFAGGHDASILAVHARKVDIGATWEGPYKRAIEKGLIKPEDVFVIWKSDGIPRSPIAVRGDMDEALIQRIQQAFLDMPQKAPEALKQFEVMWERNKGYVPVTDADYEFVRQVAIGLGKL